MGYVPVIGQVIVMGYVIVFVHTDDLAPGMLVVVVVVRFFVVIVIQVVVVVVVVVIVLVADFVEIGILVVYTVVIAEKFETVVGVALGVELGVEFGLELWVEFAG
jgi:hypothetical protein